MKTFPYFLRRSDAVEKHLHQKSPHIYSDLLLLGETLIDIFIDYQGNKHTLFGGSPANICVNTKQLGLKPLLVSTIGKDAYGDFLLSKLNDFNIDTRFINRCNSVTSSVMVNQTNASPTPTFFRGCDYNIELTDDLIDAVKHTKVFHFSYWPLTREPSKSTVLKLVDIAKENNVLISFDPNIHRDLLAEDSISRNELMDLLKKVDIIKPSLDDAARLFGFAATKDLYMDQFETLNIHLILMTLGEKGVYVSENKNRVHYATYATSIVDSTGAGDAFWSGFYGGYLNNYNLKDSVALGQITSGFVLKQIGAIIDLPNVESLSKLLSGRREI